MDKYTYIKILHSINDEDEFNNVIKGTKLTPSDLKSEISSILTDRYLSENKGTISHALFNLLNPKKKYMLTNKVSDDDSQIELIGTKEEVIDYMVNSTYSRIEDMRADTPEFQFITKEDTLKYYDTNFRNVKLVKGTSNVIGTYHYWNYGNEYNIDFYDMYLLGEINVDYYLIYDMDDIETLSKSNKKMK